MIQLGMPVSLRQTGEKQTDVQTQLSGTKEQQKQFSFLLNNYFASPSSSAELANPVEPGGETVEKEKKKGDLLTPLLFHFNLPLETGHLEDASYKEIEAELTVQPSQLEKDNQFAEPRDMTSTRFAEAAVAAGVFYPEQVESRQLEELLLDIEADFTFSVAENAPEQIEAELADNLNWEVEQGEKFSQTGFAKIPNQLTITANPIEQEAKGGRQLQFRPIALRNQNKLSQANKGGQIGELHLTETLASSDSKELTNELIASKTVISKAEKGAQEQFPVETGEIQVKGPIVLETEVVQTTVQASAPQRPETEDATQAETPSIAGKVQTKEKTGTVQRGKATDNAIKQQETNQTNFSKQEKKTSAKPRFADNGNFAYVEQLEQNLEPVFEKSKVALEGRAVVDLTREESVVKLTEHIKTMVSEERTEVRLQLKPEHLGELRIKLSLERGLMLAEFIVENESVREVLASQLPQLHTALQEQGTNVGEMMVNIGFGHGNPQQENSQGTAKPRLQRRAYGENPGVVGVADKASVQANPWNRVDLRA